MCWKEGIILPDDKKDFIKGFEVRETIEDKNFEPYEKKVLLEVIIDV